MKIDISESKEVMGGRAAALGGDAIREALSRSEGVSVIVATGASQFEMLEALAREPGIDWSLVTLFHLDEYVGMTETHPASFRRYLRERFIDRLPAPPKAFHAIDAEIEPEAECRRLSALIESVEVEVAFVGIGENGHLAFNDPPADFVTTQPYLIVELDEACRKQQLGEGWFPTLEDVPKQAISMSIRQILKSKRIVCTVPDKRKSVAVRDTVEGGVTPFVPASALQEHPLTTLFLDPHSASLLNSGR